MANSDLIKENGEYVRDAINSGISASAVSSTVNDMLKKSEKTGEAPKQVRESVETIADMKRNVNTVVDENYSSELVRNNSDRINRALRDGIEPTEITTTLINSTNNADNRDSKRKLSFIVKLVSKMKKKELVLDRQKQDGKSYQKVKE